MKTTHKTALVAMAALAAVATGLTFPAAANADSRAVVQVDLGRHNDWNNDRRGGWDNDRRGGWDDRRGGWDDHASREIDFRIDRLQDRIEMGERSRMLSHREADRLNERLNRIQWTKQTFERSGRGLDGREVAMLNDSLDRLSNDIRYQGHDRDRW